MIGPVHFLDLRGGGPMVNDGSTATRDCGTAGPPVLGGGVARWLDDDPELALWEEAEVARRATEAMVLAAPARPHHQGNMVILGTRGEERIAVCDSCRCDISLAGVSWWRCRCGRYKCNACDRSECSQCHWPRWERATVREAVRHREETDCWGWYPHQDLPAEDAIDTLVDGAPPTPRPRFEYQAPPPAVPADQPRMVCRACGSRSDQLPTGSTWRICNCGSTYCQWCLDTGCWDCPVLKFFDPHEQDSLVSDDGSQHGKRYDTVVESWTDPP